MMSATHTSPKHVANGYSVPHRVPPTPSPDPARSLQNRGICQHLHPLTDFANGSFSGPTQLDQPNHTVTAGTMKLPRVSLYVLIHERTVHLHAASRSVLSVVWVSDLLHADAHEMDRPMDRSTGSVHRAYTTADPVVPALATRWAGCRTPREVVGHCVSTMRNTSRPHAVNMSFAVEYVDGDRHGGSQRNKATGTDRWRMQ